MVVTITTSINKPGATPKVTISAKESNCLPISLLAFNFRAKNPSKKSKKAPKKITNGAKSILPAKVKRMETTPHIKFDAVNKFGILNIDFFFDNFLVAQSNKIELVCTTKVINFKIRNTSNINF